VAESGNEVRAPVLAVGGRGAWLRTNYFGLSYGTLQSFCLQLSMASRYE